jgi:hypothetical protein
MAIARAKLVDLTVTRWYHCVSRCVRKAFLLGEGDDNRKLWLENRLAELAEIFAVAVGGFSVMDNHLHVLLRLDPDVAQAWSDLEVVQRWGRLFPPRDKSGQPMPVTQHWIQCRLEDAQWIATVRQRLQNLGWFMKCLKEPLSRLANRQDKTRGTFFEGRFKSVAVVDEEALLKICVYIDLNPVAAKVTKTPETGAFTSIKQRVEHVEAQGKTAELAAAEEGSVAGSHVSAGLEESLWLCPIEDRRGLDSAREGMMQSFPLGSYLKLVEYTGRLFRQGKASISAELAGIFERLGFSAQSWQSGMDKLRGDRLLGRFIAASRVKLREIAKHLGVRHLVNLRGCPLR